MRPVDRFWFGRKLVLAAGDTVVFWLGVAVMSAFRSPTVSAGQLAALFLPVLGFSVAAAYAAGLYELRLVRDFVALVGGLLGSGVASWMLGTTYFYLVSPHLGLSPKITLLLVVLMAHVGMLCWRRAVLFATDFSLFDLKIVILAEQHYRDYLHRSLGHRSGEEFNLTEDVTADVNLVVVDRRWSKIHPEDARRALAAAIEMMIPIISIDEFYESLFGKVSPEHANDLSWALEHVLPRSGSLYFKVKRFADIVAAAALLLILLPTMILVAVAIVVADKRSPLYGQTRIGYLGRPFRLWKFRTMHLDADRKGPFHQLSQDEDRRVTALGYFLRRIRIDELPQLWNVLRGDMSLVGPRPEWTEEVEILETAIPTYPLRYLVPPGITGWAQVYFRGTNNPLDSIEKHTFDLYYLKHFSLALDFSIMLKTIKRVFVHDSRVLGVPSPRPFHDASDVDARFDIASIVGRR